VIACVFEFVHGQRVLFPPNKANRGWCQVFCPYLDKMHPAPTHTHTHAHTHARTLRERKWQRWADASMRAALSLWKRSAWFPTTNSGCQLSLPACDLRASMHINTVPVLPSSSTVPELAGLLRECFFFSVYPSLQRQRATKETSRLP
jgi:hypothetical protein